MIRKVAVIMGSDSDWPVVKGACSQLKDLGIPFEAISCRPTAPPPRRPPLPARPRKMASA